MSNPSIPVAGSVGCYHEGCTNPVNGQCQGYPGRCGRFCCAEHSIVDNSEGFLCLECAHRLAVDREEREREELEKRLFELYLTAAESVPRTNIDNLIWAATGITVILIFACLALIAIAGGSDRVGVPVECIFPTALILAGIYYLLRKQQAQRRINALTALLPGFDRFYAEWSKHRQAEQQRQALLTLFAVSIAAVATAAARERRISEIEQGVRRALRE